MEWQERIRLIHAKIDRLKDLQAKTASALNAMRLSIIDKGLKVKST